MVLCPNDGGFEGFACGVRRSGRVSGHIYSLKDIDLATPSIVTIGVFDGVHLGHQRLVRRLVQEARESNRTSVVLTFFPHPDVVLRGVTGRYYLTSPEVRARLLLDMGVDLVITHAFNREISQIRATDFVEQLCTHLKMATLWVGPDFALGYRREGDVPFLRAQGAARGFTVETVELRLTTGGSVISSSSIREALTAGDVEQAAAWLGRPYRIVGEVVVGDRRGRTIGFPTANLRVWEEQLLPANGVYAGWAYWRGERLMAVANLGIQPTFDGAQMKVEAHLLDFDRDIYGETLELAFVRWLRAEQRFNSVAELVEQIQRDAASGRAILEPLMAQEQH